MNATTSPELINHLCKMTSMSRSEAEHLLREILSFYEETLEEFVSRRHRELQAAGYSNNRIYRQINDELPIRRFPAPPLSERQIRRLIYG